MADYLQEIKDAVPQLECVFVPGDGYYIFTELGHYPCDA